MGQLKSLNSIIANKNYHEFLNQAVKDIEKIKRNHLYITLDMENNSGIAMWYPESFSDFKEKYIKWLEEMLKKDVLDSDILKKDTNIKLKGTTYSDIINNKKSEIHPNQILRYKLGDNTVHLAALIFEKIINGQLIKEYSLTDIREDIKIGGTNEYDGKMKANNEEKYVQIKYKKGSKNKLDLGDFKRWYNKEEDFVLIITEWIEEAPTNTLKFEVVKNSFLFNISRENLSELIYQNDPDIIECLNLFNEFHNSYNELYRQNIKEYIFENLPPNERPSKSENIKLNKYLKQIDGKTKANLFKLERISDIIEDEKMDEIERILVDLREKWNNFINKIGKIREVYKVKKNKNGVKMFTLNPKIANLSKERAGRFQTGFFVSEFKKRFPYIEDIINTGNDGIPYINFEKVNTFFSNSNEVMSSYKEGNEKMYNIMETIMEFNFNEIEKENDIDKVIGKLDKLKYQFDIEKSYFDHKVYGNKLRELFQFIINR